MIVPYNVRLTFKRFHINLKIILLSTFKNKIFVSPKTNYKQIWSQYRILVQNNLKLERMARDWLVHLNLEVNLLALELLKSFSMLHLLNVHLSNTSLWQADKVDGLLPQLLGNSVDRALDNWVLGEADLVILVDDGVLHDGFAISHLRLKD